MSTPIADMVRRLGAAGCSIEQIAVAVEALELPELEKKATRRYQNRIAQQNHRSRQHDIADCQHDIADIADASLIEEESKKEIKEERKKETLQTQRVRKGGVGENQTRRRPIPPDWLPKETHAQLAMELDVPLADAEAIFRETTAAKGTLYVNHDMAFRTYLRNYRRFNGDQQPHKPTEQPLSPQARELARKTEEYRALLAARKANAQTENQPIRLAFDRDRTECPDPQCETFLSSGQALSGSQ